MKRSSSHAFTLIELAIVVTVIALVVGGVLAGQSLVEAAKLNTVIKDANEYIVAANAFKRQYNALPGDFLNAQTYWPSSHNGDGNGQIDSLSNEATGVWQQLSLAGFVSGSYSGTLTPTCCPNSAGYIFGSNIPGSKVNGAGFSIVYLGDQFTPYTGLNDSYPITFGNTLIFGAYSFGPYADHPYFAVLTPTQAFSIDSKIDDGVPGRGNWIANLTGPQGPDDPDYNFVGGAKACVNGTAAGPGTYNLKPDHDVINCSFNIKTGL